MRLLFYILVLAAVAWLGLFLYQNPGNIELAYQDWVVEVSISALVVGGLCLILVYTLLAYIFKAYRKIREWITGSTLRAVTKNANQGWSCLAEGDWTRAEACMLKAAKHSETPEHYYVAAARAAQELGAIDRRDNSLRLALRANSQDQLAIGIVQVKLQLKQGQLEHSLVTLQELLKLAPHNLLVLKLSSQVFATMQEWGEVIKILPLLRKHRVLDQYATDQLEAKAYSFILRAEAKKSGLQALLAFWDTLPRAVRHQVLVVQEYAQLLLDLGSPTDAELILRTTLKRQWDLGLIKLYGFSLGTDLGKQISLAESWLRSNQTEPVLLLTLARLCLAHKLWGKARSYLDSSLALDANPDAFAELGRLLVFLGEHDKALDCYKNGLLTFANILPIEQAQK